MKSRLTKIQIIVICLVALAALGTALYFQVYRLNSNDPLSIVLKKAFPAYISGGGYVSVYHRLRMSKILLNLDPGQDRKKVDEVISQNLIKEGIFKKLGLSLESDEIADELSFLKNGKEDEYKSHLNRYFDGNEPEFISYVVYPTVIDKKLRIYFAKNQIYAAERSKAQDLLEELKSGKLEFEKAARELSEDEYTGQFGGDLGFFEHGQIIPELEKEIVISQLGKLNSSLVESRFGYHIVFPVEISYSNGKKLWHAKHILIKTEGYEKWISDNANKNWLIRFVK